MVTQSLYHRTQRGTVILLTVVVSAVVAVVIVSWIVSRSGPVDPAGLSIAVAIIVALCAGVAWYFSSMTVEVTGDELRWTVGHGRPYSIPRSDIQSLSVVRHSLWHGYGIRWLGPKRWTYIVSGRDTVEVRLKDGGWRRIGTDDPQGLIAALGGARSTTPSF